MYFRLQQWRFSLAAAFVCLGVAAVAAAVYGSHLRDLEAEEVAFQRIAASGGNIYVFDESGERRVHVSFNRRERVGGGDIIRFVARSESRPVVDEVIEWLADVNDLGSVTFPWFEATDERIDRLKQFHTNCRVNR